MDDNEERALKMRRDVTTKRGIMKVELISLSQYSVSPKENGLNCNETN